MNSPIHRDGAITPMPALLRICLLPLAAATLSLSAPRASADDAPPHHAFSLLPKSMQKNPDVHLSIITEMTMDGGKVREPSAARPLYYLSHAIGYHDEGQGYAEKPLIPVDQLQDKLQAALAENHFLPADAAHPATLVIFFSWGSANKIDNRTDAFLDASPAPSATEDSNGNAAVSDSGGSTYFELPLDVTSADEVTRNNFMARAQLVGGVRFAHDVLAALQQEDLTRLDGFRAIGLQPLDLLQERNPTYGALLQQCMDDCYYVVASAYDAYAMAHGQRRMLWQTKMSTSSQGVSMAETLPALIHNGAPYFGRAMAQPAVLNGHLLWEGHVDVGPTKVMPDQSSAR
jgi:hypothetical protein